MENRKETGSQAAPFIIIGLIFLITMVGMWWVYRSGKTPPSEDQNSGGDSFARQEQQEQNKYSNSPAGAEPETFKGSQNAPIIVEEFADFECGACADKHLVFNQINADYGSRIKFVFRNYPLIKVHVKAYDAAVAVEAAGIQGKFWEMQNILYANQQKWSNSPSHRSMFEEYAKTIGLNMEKYTKDSLGVAAKNRVDADMKRGQALGIRSTPTVYVNGKSVPFSMITVEGLKKAIDAELERIESNKSKQNEINSPDQNEDEKAEEKGANAENKYESAGT